MTIAYVLYKRPVQPETLLWVRWLFHACGIDARPSVIVEREHPGWVTSLPSIKDLDDGKTYVGLDACVQFLEHKTGVRDIVERSAGQPCPPIGR